MSSAKSSSRTTAKKDNSKKRVVTLRIPPEQLAKIWDLKLPSPKPSTLPPPSDTKLSPSAQPSDSAQRSTDSNDTPAPSATNADADTNSLAPPKPDAKKKKGGGGLSGRKRAPPMIDPDAPPRERGRPGPKKKPRLPDGTIDRTIDPTKKAPVTSNPGPVSHKLGPKANTGAINAGLRALDRTGRPCRKWERKGFQLKSFTGTTWSMSSWKTSVKDSGFAGDVKSDSSGSSDVKPADSSAIASERSHSGGDAADTTMMNGIESSPVPPAAA